ncbi:MAG: amino acid ABC transporter permease [Clostridiales Family XIII bacterium]|jgi:polar amino acid transport system permease protein|nr:amino acid ABC transporter permease [Clostridiales Family XIII bacterium]
MDPKYLADITAYIAMGGGVTLKVFIVTLIFSIPLGIICALGKLSRFRILHGVIGTYTWVFRGTPLLLQLFFTYYGLAILTNSFISFTPLTAIYITFVFNYAAYFTEIFRAGIQSIGRGQYEASKALGMPPWLTMRRIILPQAVKTILPPMGNECINLIKDTALCYVVAVPEILKNAKVVMSRDFNVGALAIAAVLYLILTFIVIQIFRKIEKKYAYYTIK